MPEPKRLKPPDPAILRAALLPLSLLLAILVYYGLGQPFSAVIAVAAPFMVLFVVSPFWARASLRAYDREVIPLLAVGEHRAAQARLRRALGMRLFAPPALVQERRGMLAAEAGEPVKAKKAYGRAVRGYEDGAPDSVLLGYAHACFATGEHRRASELYRKVLAQAGALPRVRRNLAECLVEIREDLPEAMRLLDLELAAVQDAGDRKALKKLRRRAERGGGPSARRRRRRPA